MKVYKIVYWATTILLCILMLYSASMYFTKTEMVKGFFESLDYPTYIVIPLAIAKVLGVIIILWRKSVCLTEWAYAGFFFDMVLASFAHYFANQGIGLSVYGLILLLISYYFGKTVR